MFGLKSDYMALRPTGPPHPLTFFLNNFSLVVYITCKTQIDLSPPPPSMLTQLTNFNAKKSDWSKLKARGYPTQSIHAIRKLVYTYRWEKAVHHRQPVSPVLTNLDQNFGIRYLGKSVKKHTLGTALLCKEPAGNWNTGRFYKCQLGT